MKELILRASPKQLAIVGALPFLIAVATVFTQPMTLLGTALFAGGIYLGVALVLTWCWVVGHALNLRISEERRPPIATFRMATFFVAFYCALFLATAGGGAAMIAQNDYVFAALHLGAIAAMVRVLHFIGVNLSLAEDETCETDPSLWSTILALFSLGGILPVQERVNRIFHNAQS